VLIIVGYNLTSHGPTGVILGYKIIENVLSLGWGALPVCDIIWLFCKGSYIHCLFLLLELLYSYTLEATFSKTVYKTSQLQLIRQDIHSHFFSVMTHNTEDVHTVHPVSMKIPLETMY
jgi:hypothetical protein